MDDQFNGRTDDDLFADDFEPVPVPEDQEAEKLQVPPSPTPAAAESAVEASAQSESQDAIPESAAPIPTPAPKSLAQSRHNRPAPAARPPRQPSGPGSSSGPAPSSTARPTTGATTGATTTPPAPATSEKYDPNTRLKSGANPRTKLTEEELAAKMEKMRILSAEKTRRFEQAQRDESDHAIAYAKHMEEARKRRAVEEERRRRGDEERRKMEDERAKNRERKLHAMGQKQGGWDEGKEERLAEEERRGFRGANGGIRGTKRGGLAGSRFAEIDDLPAERDYGGDRGNRGRGRGRGAIRGGRGGLNDGNTENGASRPNPQPPTMTTEDFPALPMSDNTKAKAPVGAIPKKPPPIQTPILPLSPAIGGWDDEMAAIDANHRKS